MSGILRGQDYVAARLPLIAIRANTGSITAKPASKSAWETAFYGVKKINTITAIADNTGSLNVQWCKIYTPAFNYVMWLNINGAGALSTIKAAVASAGITVDKYIEIVGATNATAVQLAENMTVAINATDDMTAVRTTDAVAITCTYGGVCNANADGTDTTGFTFVEGTAGAGTWNILEESSENPILKTEKDQVVKTSRKSEINATEKVTVDFFMMNFTAHNYNYARSLYNKKSCEVVYYDPDTRGGAIEIVHDIPINVVDEEVQGVKAIHFSGMFSAVDSDVNVVRYDFTT